MDNYEETADLEKMAYGILGESEPWDDYERDYTDYLPY